MKTEWNRMLSFAKEWALEAGEELLKKGDGPLQMTSKTSAIDLVTEMDVWTENYLKKNIQTHFPDHAIITEESGGTTGSAPYEWVIDPIDGTVNYARGIPFYGISIGIRYEKETVIGLVHAPKLGETYEAIKGEGAFLNGEKITVSTTDELERAVLATGFPYDKGVDEDNNLSHFQVILPKIGGIRRFGSAALDLCQVATGRLDGYWELKLNDWDVEAGLLIVEEAGGKTSVKREEKGLFIIGANEAMFSELERLIER